MGFDQVYLLVADGAILVDAGAPKKIHLLEKGLSQAGVPPADVRLAVLTHGHWDHIGSAKAIRHLTGAKIALHFKDAHLLKQGLVHLSPGVVPWGKLFMRVHQFFMPLIRIEPCDVDILISDEGMNLNEYGIPGRVVYTPGHTHGSVSVLLDSGEAFVGDLAMNRFPLRLSPGEPIFAVDQEQVRASWRKLMEAGARMFYPAHGKAFPVSDRTVEAKGSGPEFRN